MEETLEITVLFNVKHFFPIIQPAIELSVYVDNV